MKFQKGTRRRAVEYEKDMLEYWKDNKTFEKSVETRPKDNAFVFYDGPPFLTGKPHHGHLLISSVKDAVARYQTMQGKHVERRWGWDCHGLPAELFVEKKLGIANKKEIGVKISIADYVKECRAAMVKTGTEWEDTIDRIGRWVEFKGAYKTMDNDYMESVWWAFKKLFNEGKIYEGEKILVYCTKDATPISKSEVAMENSYQMDTDPSVYVKLKLVGRDASLLAWTTTPWTLPANTAAAVNSNFMYAEVRYGKDNLIMAEDLVKKVMVDEKHQLLDYEIITTFKGSDLVGESYEPLFVNHGPKAHLIWDAPYVSEEDGTGVVHLAPAYGEEDYDFCKEKGIPIVSLVDENGLYTEGPWLGKNIWEINKEIAKTLVADGRALKVEYIQHEYPHCHRCNGKLMYRAHPSWFMDIQGQKELMLESNEQTNWTPKHLQEGRFKNIIKSAPDWNLSRDRYWATPIPVWRGVRNDGTEVIKAIGSYEEFEDLTGKKLDDYHLPNVMDIEFEYDGTTLKHIGKVLDCWFESGSMPFAQFHYPFENKQKFEDSFPADFIVEAIDQTRGWFYSLTAVNVALFGKSPFKNLICTGFIKAGDGLKMSKKLGNYTDPLELMDQYSADSFRFLMMSSPLVNGEDFNLKDRDVGDVARKLGMIWNMYDFLTLYADVDKWDSGLKEGELPLDPSEELKNPLDKWIVSRVHQLNKEVDEHMQKYDLPNALKPILPFLDDASNWYVRRSRKRFWKSDNDDDKNQAYKTLHYVLVHLSMIVAPFTPFMAEELFRLLTKGESVHLQDWPEVGYIDEQVLTDMDYVRGAVNLGLAKRAEAGIKVRQPLAHVTVYNALIEDDYLEYYKSILEEELNIKEVAISRTSDVLNPEDMQKIWADKGYAKQDGGLVELVLDTEMTPELQQEGLMREIIRNIQNARKNAGLEVDDRIDLVIKSDSKEFKAVLTDDKLSATIKAETLAENLNTAEFEGFEVEVKIEGHPATIKLAKA